MKEKEKTVRIKKTDLDRMLMEAYNDGYAQGGIDQILRSTPSYSIDKQKEAHFYTEEKPMLFRATIL